MKKVEFEAIIISADTKSDSSVQVNNAFSVEVISSDGKKHLWITQDENGEFVVSSSDTVVVNLHTNTIRL